MNLSKNLIIYAIALILVTTVATRIYAIKQQQLQINQQTPTQLETNHIYDLLLYK